MHGKICSWKPRLKNILNHLNYTINGYLIGIKKVNLLL